MSNSVFAPGHITGFFTIEDHEISLKKGSCGAGFLLSKGVKTTISQSNNLKIEVNRGNSKIIDEVLSIMDIDTDFKITQDIQLPIAAGFGTSAASALSLTLALNDFLNLGYSRDLCGQIAHMAEINLGGGLGDVIAQTGKGLVLRTASGAPGIGEIKSFCEEVYIAWKSFGEIQTSSVINDITQRENISTVGLKYLEYFEEKSSLKNFLDFSNKFARETQLMTRDVRNAIENIKDHENILGSSMAMLGNTVFIFSYDKATLKNLNIDDLHIDELNNIGIVYD